MIKRKWQNGSEPKNNRLEIIMKNKRSMNLIAACILFATMFLGSSGIFTELGVERQHIRSNIS